MKPKTIWVTLALLAGGLCGLGAIYVSHRENSSIETLQKLDRPSLRKKAEKGDPKAQYLLGRALLFPGADSEMNVPEACQWLGKASNQGFAPAQARLGAITLEGKGVTKNIQEGLRLIRLAVEQKDPEGYAFLGTAYFGGLGVPEDNGQALKWIRKSAEMGNREGEYFLAAFYLFGAGVDKNKDEAMKWARMADEHGHPVAKVLIKNIEKMPSANTPQPTPPTQATAEPSPDSTGQPVYADNVIEILSLDMRTYPEGTSGRKVSGIARNKTGAFISEATVFLKCYDNSGVSMGTSDFTLRNIDGGEKIKFDQAIRQGTAQVKVTNIQY